MTCIDCQTKLDNVFNLDYQDEDRPIHYTHQWYKCPNCGQTYTAKLEEDKVNIFNDTLLHQGYRIDEETWKKSLEEVKNCPDPRNESCTCQIHQDIPSLPYGKMAWYVNE